MAKPAKDSLCYTGAEAGAIVIGVYPLNEGVRIHVCGFQHVEPDGGSRLEGSFVVLDAGCGAYRAVFEKFINKTTNAEEFIRCGKALGGKFAKMTHPINKGSLKLADR